ncbi:hypothetical protein [Cypionkella sp.]|uniref:hypothetical protein n=1 Tax=Cypionkella sp. TaxID=2811411 RepID=UPI002718D3A3|nr:hypothetical protein [Cypionkella sp.]MDO8983645.1 hypothetical protein [Cypionkella sp.]MDP1576219.1 hypothetical protein [Cypionkella sp.]MDP2050120.1 hypothetical protein [Cypionkella sp.]
MTSVLQGCLLIILFVAVVLLAFGLDYVWKLMLLLGVPFIFLFVLSSIRAWTFGPVPAKVACLYPRDEVEDCRRRYKDLMLGLSMFWLHAVIMVLFCNWVLEGVLGEDYVFFEFHPSLQKRGSQSEYSLFQAVMAIEGAIALSGLLWLPMYAFFERLEMQKSIRSLGGILKSGETNA